MLRPFRPLALLPILAACAPVGRPAAAPAPGADSRAREIACDLSDRVGPRLAGSPGDARAVAWALAEMKSLGLANVRAEPVKVPHWERGAATATILAEGIEQPLAVPAPGGSVATPPGGIEGEVPEVPSI